VTLALALVIVLRVVDGDTLHVLDGERDVAVRVLGLDCPESTRNPKCRRLGAAACEDELPLGRAATARARELLHPGDRVRLEGHRLDRYGRTLASVQLAEGRDLAAVLRSEGWCRAGGP